ncbi:hypothetical protein QF035_009018 [Streptomyces umbrinus]|uniref:Lipoprotein n=1 Tax=Streptomyces umbrinus TaxID=67370 RepID=A0ABU0T8Z0_9ACTN|nr:hypothetical protein [Streptomyces umbrinus]MDQ1031436.1 hypothetical protein [Streptomyces umbrinus]
MLHHKNTLLIVAPVAVLALTLSACGDADNSANADVKESTTPKSNTAPEAAASQSEEASGGELAAGESATATVKEESGNVTYEITAEKVELGTEAEAAKLVRDPADAKGMALAVAHLKFTHKSGPALTSDSEANDSTVIYADGQKGALLIGASDDAPGCEDPYDIEGWAPSESHTLCESYLVPAAAKEVEVHWSEEDGEPYIWKFPNG